MEGISTTLVLIGVTCLVSLSAFGNPKLIGRLVLWPPAIARNGEYWRLLTYGFVHAGGMHLLFNMITLYFFGRLMENFIDAHLGDWGFVFFYLSALVVAILPSWLRHRDDAKYMSLGASGAVTAVLFAFILLRPWSMIVVFVLPMPAIVFAVAYLGYTLWMDYRKADHINHGAHLAGAIYGVLFMLLLDPRVLAYFLHELAHPRLGS